MLMAITITGILLVSSFFAQLASSAVNTYGTDNMTVTGVLSSDSYVLYPYEPQDLVWGFSKYGELINGAAKQGLEYNGIDVFANPHVLEKDWSQGWLIDIHYADLGNNYKRAWAYALYTDTSTADGIGGDWKENSTNGPLGLPYGGRKTNVWATTDPIKVLYDGPRRFVAQTRTTLYGASDRSLANSGLVNITLTFEFNKDKKQIIVFKDIKRLDQGKFGRSFQVEFSNRGEWDIGTTSAPPSYAYFYDDQSTVYDYHYHDYYSASHPLTGYDMCQMINEAGTHVGYVAYWPQLFGKMVKATNTISRTEILTSLTTVEKNQTWLTLGSPSNKIITLSGQGWPSADAYPRGAGEALDDPMVFKNGVLQFDPGDYDWTGDQSDSITFVSEPADTDYITIEYKHMIPTGRGYDNMGAWSAEPGTPYVIGEWAFELSTQPQSGQFRGVSVYGLTDRHNADDYDAYHGLNTEDWSNGADVIDDEVEYLLKEVFNPFDLYGAVEKKDYRWVDIRDLDAATSYITLTDGLDDDIWCNKTDLDWSGYKLQYEGAGCAAEWVNAFEDTATYTAHSSNWALSLSANASGYARVRITPTGFGQNGTYRFGNLTEISFWYKKLTAGYYGPHMFVKLSNGTAASEVNIQMYNNPVPSPTGWEKVDLSNIDAYTDQSGADEAFWYTADASTYNANGPMYGVTPGAGIAKHSFDFYRNKLANYYVTDIVVELGYNLVGSTVAQYLIDDIDVGYLTETDGIRHERVYNMEEDKLIPSDWNAYCSFAERVLIDGTLIDRYPYHLLRNYVEGGHAPYYMIDFATGNLTFYHYVTSAYTTWTLPIDTHVKVLYSTIEKNEKGRYEWMVLGKDARTIDSAAAAYVSEAFDSTKDIRVEMMGLDIREYDYGPNSPYVMNGTGTGTRTDYVDSLGRPHLKDDWCTTWPVASSDMIFMAGPRANLGTEYMNEFTNAFFARSEYVVNNTGQANTIMGLSCWNFNTYASGIGVISVYKDLNGTIGLVFWGYNADDYYYTCKWFWNYAAGITCPDGAIVYSGIEYLQHENRGVTDILLHIDYPTADPTHPTVSLTAERLGTISEKHPHDP
jgi:hypothetical protein